MDLFRMMDDFDTEKECRTALAELRWPEGVKCPRDQGDKHAYDSERYVWDCYSCGYQFSVMSGTIFHDTKLPLRKWFLAVLLMVEAARYQRQPNEAHPRRFLQDRLVSLSPHPRGHEGR